MAEIMTYNTYKKKYQPSIYQTWDGGGKGWARSTVDPTMRNAGFESDLSNDIDLDPRKPRQILNEDFNNFIDTCEIVVYRVAEGTGAYAGFFKYLDIYYIAKEGRSPYEDYVLE